MRTLLLGLIPMLLATVVRADVLALSNLSTINGTTSAGGLGLDIDFRVSSSTSFNGVSLFRSGGGTVNVIAFSGPTYSNQLGNVNGVVGSLIASNEYFFSFGAGSSLVFDPGTDYRIRVTLIDSGYETTANSVLTLPGDSPIALSPTPITNQLASTPNGGGYARFQLYAVPEPGTLILGSFAAISGAGGVWWKRRKKRTVVVGQVQQISGI